MSNENEAEQPKLPEFSRRLGAPIATVRPVGKPPSKVTGRPRAETSSADLGVLPGPDGQPVPAEDAPDAVDSRSFYAQVGGRQTFQKIVDVFYDQVAEDPEFRAMYPEEDLAPAKRRLLMFLEQYWGGPRTYSEQRGHPRLRMRHFPFTIGPIERDAWLRCMQIAVDEENLAPEHREQLWNYLQYAAASMQNSEF